MSEQGADRRTGRGDRRRPVDTSRPPAFLPRDTKLRAPPLPPRLIARPRLTRRLSGEGSPLVLFSAPAGAGKTLAIREWLAAGPRPWAWLRLDDEDNDPVTLLEYLARVLLDLTPLDPAVLGWLELADPPVRRVVLPAMVSAAGGAPAFALVLDDAHLLRDERCWRILAAVAEGTSAGSSLVIGSRSDPPLPLGRLRSQGMLAEYRLPDLVFDRDETRAVLTLHGVTGDDVWLDRVCEVTEGWPVGVALVGLSARDGIPLEPPSPMGDERAVADYLMAEVLSTQPAHVTELLTRSAVADRICPALCDALTGRDDGAAVLERLVHENLPLLPLDERRVWYRCHHLLRELLLSELERRDPELVPELHRRAAVWFREAGEPGECLHHLLAAGEIESAADVVTAEWWPHYLGGHVWTARQWLDLFTGEQVREYAGLRLAGAWVYAFTGEPDMARGLVRGLAPSSLDDLAGDDKTRSPHSSLLMIRALLAADGPYHMREDAREAVRLEEGSPGPWPSFCDLVLGVAELLCGDDDSAAQTLWRTARSGKVLRNGTDLAALGELSLIAGDRGDWQEATACALEAARRAEAFATGDHLPAALARLARDRLCVRDGDEDAVSDLEDLYAHASRDFCPWVGIRAAQLLAEARLSQGDVREAVRLLREARTALSRWAEAPGLVRRLDRLERAVLQRVSPDPPSPAELRVLELLPTNLTAREIADRLSISPNTVGTHMKSLHRKLGATRRSELVERAAEAGLLPARELPH
jgi:LuxR family transcriptional regulator, maltose regulon positive regulatory protein